MDKFQVLQNNRRFMSSILRIDIEQKNDARLKSADKFFTSVPVLLILFVLSSALLSSAVQMHSNSHDFTVRLAAALVLIAMCQAFIVLLDMGLNMKDIVTLYRKLQTIVDREGINLTFEII